MTVKDRFQVVISAQVDEHSQFSVCESCGAVVPRHPLLLAGYTSMDCQEIHHQWHERLERLEKVGKAGRRVGMTAMSDHPSQTHGLWAFEEDFLSDGTRARCTCGWESEPQVDPNKAMEQLKARQAWEAHAKEAEGTGQ